MIEAASDASEQLRLYRWMAMSRALGTTLSALNPRWFPAEGEEATLVGSFYDLRKDDAAAPHYRDPFVVYLMRGAELWRLVAQVIGKSAGYNKGRSVPFNGPFELGIVPWVAGDLGTTIGTATGTALAFRQEGSDRVSVCTFGDGTSNRGDFHENLNLAALWRLPIVYICQNNGWAISQTADSYLPAPVAARAAGYGIPGVTVDGQDIEAVRAAVSEAIARARRGEGPTLIEALTGRRRGHWAGQNVADPVADERRRADPLELFAGRLIERGHATASQRDEVGRNVAAEIADAVERAKASQDAADAALGVDDVYA
jgi:acetoin:2,6-dichlorophenolindophenol oxidoreductase subunit alpha